MTRTNDKPVTRQELRVELKVFKEEMREEMGAFKEEVRGFKEEILHHFDAVAENIHNDVASANHDEISLIQNKVQDHEERIIVLEQKV